MKTKKKYRKQLFLLHKQSINTIKREEKKTCRWVKEDNDNLPMQDNKNSQALPLEVRMYINDVFIADVWVNHGDVEESEGARRGRKSYKVSLGNPPTSLLRLLRLGNTRYELGYIDLRLYCIIILWSSKLHNYTKKI